jgi:integrase
MADIEKYVRAATRENTRRSYKSDIEHYEIEWGGFLPATANSVARYLADYAECLAIGTLRHRLAALAKWHQGQGFADPTKAPLVKSVLKGIGELHPRVQKQVKPLQFDHLELLIQWLDGQLCQAVSSNHRQAVLKHSRDKALLLIGFWRAFRSDELCRLRVESIVISPGQGMEIYLQRSKGDRNSKGRCYKAPALKRLCPVTAYQDWVDNACLTEGPVFRGISRWGHISDNTLHVDSVVTVLRELFKAAEIPGADGYSSRSLRRGFATWANDSQWDVKTLMEYVGWKDITSAMRYIDAPDSFSQQRIEDALNKHSILSTGCINAVDEVP